MPEALFLFVQLEYPWLLGPPDGRYLLRASADADPERVVVLGTLSAARVSGAARGPLAGRLGARRTLAETTPEPAAVSTARVTIVDPVPVSAERQAQAWLENLDAEREAAGAVEVLNRILHFHRISAADPHVNEVSAAQALVIRVGWGAGEQVADGRWLQARELVLPAGRATGTGAHGGRGSTSGGRRSARRASLGHELRFAHLLGGRERGLLCEELALRARLDLDRGRLRHAALELDGAIASAVAELASEGRPDLTIRIAELEKLHEGIARQAALARAPAEANGAEPLDGELIEHATRRLEAALRARAFGAPARS